MGRNPDDRLLTDIKVRKKRKSDRVTGDSFGKRFGRFKVRVLKGSEDAEDKNFHSFRHWTATNLRLAGVDEPTVALILGHKHKAISFGRYGKLTGAKLTAEQREKLRGFVQPEIDKLTLPTAALATIAP